jgi:two-component system, OmpR family, KDP operon response regulator KdpE
MEGSGRSAASRMEQRSHSRSLTAGLNKRPDKAEMQGARVLIIDDEPGIRRFLRASLMARGYDLYEAGTGQDGIQSVPIVRPDVIILDLGLPDVDGIDVIRSLREWTQTPIIILSVREQESDKIAALDAGADDYLIKPFGVGELLARIRAALRRGHTLETGVVFTAGDLEVDLVRRVVRLSDRNIQLTPTEYDLLKVLVRHAGKVLTHRQVVREVWGGACYEDEMHLLRVNISNLRRKLEVDPARPRHILTEPGVGYRLRSE